MNPLLPWLSKLKKFLPWIGLAVVLFVLLGLSWLCWTLPWPLRLWAQVLILVLTGLMALGIYGVIEEITQPMHELIRQTEEALEGLRENVSVDRDGDIGRLANNFSQIILDAQVKRYRLESSRQEVVTHAEILEKTYRELDKKVYDLFTLFNISKELGSTLSVETISKITCFTSMGQVGVTSMTVAMLETRGERPRMIATFAKGLKKDPERVMEFAVGEKFIELLSTSEQAIPVSELEGKPEFAAEFQALNTFKTFLIVPLSAKEEVIGVLLLGKKLSGDDFGQAEREFLATLTTMAALALRNAQHYEEAITDGMTRLFLKRYFGLRLEDELRRVERYKSKMSLLMADIDHFKRINDTYGHTKGDEVLIRVARAIKDNFRDVDVAARYGGEEFSVIMPEVTKEDAKIAAERLRKNVEAIPFVLDGKPVTITISIGLAEFPKDAGNPIKLVEAADAALYHSKENGRNQTSLFSPHETPAGPQQ